MQAVILAGGKGTRLKPFTNALPKPLVPVGDMPILEIVLRQLKHYGFTEVILAVNHLSDLIKAFFGNGEKVGLHIRYSYETQPLGTAGPLTVIEGLADNFLVMNGDLLTTLNYKKFFEFHLEKGGLASIATYRKHEKIDLGVLEIENGKFCKYVEKPIYDFNVSTGIYAFNKRAIGFIPHGEKYDMPNFFQTAHDQGENIWCYQSDYYWLDMGRTEDYETAVEIFNKRKNEFLPAN